MKDLQLDTEGPERDALDLRWLPILVAAAVLGAGLAVVVDGPLLPDMGRIGQAEDGDLADSSSDGEVDRRSADETNAEQPQVVVRPGMMIYPDEPLGFVLHDPDNGTWYAILDGDLVEALPGGGVGLEIEAVVDNETRVPIGEVVAYRGDSNDSAEWGLVRIYDDPGIEVNASVKHWTGPTGVSDMVPEFNDVVCMYGYGYDTTLVPGERARCGRFERWGNQRYLWHDWWIEDGWFTAKIRAHGAEDFSAPVIHHETGRAVGIVTSINYFSGYAPEESVLRVYGQTVCGVLADLEPLGWDLELATADYDPPPARDSTPSLVDNPVVEATADPDDDCEEI